MNNRQSATPDKPIQDAVTRSHRYWMEDGIVEVVLGSFWLFWAVVVLLPILFHDAVLAQLRIVLLLVSMGSMPFVLRRAIRGWKERVSFPRTGYIELRQPQSKWRLAVIVIGVGVAYEISLLGSHGSRSAQQWVALGLGVLMFLAMVISAWRMRGTRLFALSWVVLAAAVASFVFGLRFSTCSAVLLLAYGFVCLVDGLLRMRSYLKAHPAAAGATS